MDIQIRTNKQWNGISNINHNKDVVGSFSTAWYKNLTKPAGRSLNITMMTLMCKFILDLKRGVSQSMSHYIPIMVQIPSDHWSCKQNSEVYCKWWCFLVFFNDLIYVYAHTRTYSYIYTYNHRFLLEEISPPWCFTIPWSHCRNQPHSYEIARGHEPMFN